MEDYANQLMREYVKLYFGFCISSVYFFETTDTGFGACFLVKKDIDNEEGLKEGVWDSIHSFTVDTPADGKQTSYTLVSTIYMHLKSGDSESGSFQVGGMNTKNVNKTFDGVADSKVHVQRMGEMLEKNESQLRNEMDSVYVGKAQQIIGTGRIAEIHKNTKTLL